MNCQQISQYLYDYYDGTLSPHICSLIEDHLNECDSCHNNYKLTLLENEVLCDSIIIPPISESFTSTVMQAIIPASNDFTENVSPKKSKRWSTYAVLATSAALVLAMGLHVFSAYSPSEQIKVAETPSLPQAYSQPADQNPLPLEKDEVSNKQQIYVDTTQKAKNGINAIEIGEPIKVAQSDKSLNTEQILNSADNSICEFLPDQQKCVDIASTTTDRDQTSVSRSKETVLIMGGNGNKDVIQIELFKPTNIPDTFELFSVAPTNNGTIYTYTSNTTVFLEITIDTPDISSDVQSSNGNSNNSVCETALSESSAEQLDPVSAVNVTDDMVLNPANSPKEPLLNEFSGEDSLDAGTICLPVSNECMPMCSIELKKSVNDINVLLTLLSNMEETDLLNVGNKIGIEAVEESEIEEINEP